MERKMKVAVMVCVVAVMVSEGAASTAEGPASAPSAADCSNLILSLADCLSFVSNGSTVRKPEGKCCPALKSVLKTAPSCLCQAFLSSSQFGVVLNVSKALTLPAACKLSAPSFSNCALSQTPASAPAVSPTSSAGAPALNGSAGEVSPTHAPSPSPGNAASALKVPFSAGSLSVCFLAVLFSGLIP